MLENSLSKIRLLYVEDDESIRLEISELLELECLELIVANNGLDGLNKYKESHPDIILTDISMPKMSGLEMSKEIRKMNKDIPIIISSAFNDSSYLLDAINIGITHYLIKPIKLEKLFDILEKIAATLLLQQTSNENEKLLEQYKDIVDASSIVSKANKKGIITYVNDAFVKISGYTRDELIGKNHNIVRDPEMPSAVFKDLWATISAKKRWQGIVKNRTKNGGVYIVDSIIIPVVDVQGEIVEYISLRKDITQMKLQKEHLKYELDTSSNFIHEFEKAIKQNTLFCRTSVDGIFSMTSVEFDNLLHYKEGELDNTHYTDLLKFPNDKKSITENMHNGKTWQGLVQHISKDSQQLYLESSFIPIVGLNGEVLEIFCFFVDVSESVALNKEIVATQREVIATMGAIGETRSKETGDHVKRVAEYSKLLALKAGLSIEDAEELKMASPMHDIGKVAIPDSILNKPGKLTDEEFTIMKTHAELGYEMLRHSTQKLLHSAAIVAQQHHEKWNGTGYPNQLAGNDIHIFGRITAIADVFDALGHDRVYKKAWPLENILSLFQEEKGKHFDPVLIDLFVNNLDEFIAIQSLFDNENM